MTGQPSEMRQVVSNPCKGHWDRTPECLAHKHDTFVQRAAILTPHIKHFLTNYTSVHSPVTAECFDGHQWETTPSRVLISRSGCPHCYGNARKTHATFLAELAVLNASRTDQVHVRDDSPHYTRARCRIDLRCDKDHQWSAEAMNITGGKWTCPVCSENNSHSKIALEWLESLGNPNIQHRLQLGEHVIPNTKLRLDGYDPTTNTAYEFYGDYWHGNPNTHDPSAINPTCGLTYSELYERTLIREKIIRDAGYQLVTVWESDYIASKNTR